MRTAPTLLCLGVLVAPSLAFIGLGIEMYNPSCAFACRKVFESAPLSCSTAGETAGGHGGHGATGTTTPECRAGDDAFLTTIAWCIDEMCTPFSVEAWRLEKYWIDEVTGDPDQHPKWTYSQALQHVETPPKKQLGEDQTLNFTAAVPLDSWDAEKRSMEYFELHEWDHSKYGLVLLVVGFATPILLTLLGYLPYMTGFLDKIKPILVYPSTIGKYHIESLPYLIGNAPTVGQGLYITLFLILNVILTAVSYKSTQPNTWFVSTYEEIMAYISCRTGVLAMALAPLVILFSGRNNMLLWLTNWSRSTYMLLHRWVARIFGIQVIVHSIVELVLYIYRGTHATESKLDYWIWGVVGTLATSLMLVLSLLFVRRWSYQLFLSMHIVLAVFVLVGTWYHVELLFFRKWGYEYWMYAAFAVWGFDRLLRLWRMAKIGFRRANVTDLGEGYVRVDVEGLRWPAMPGHHAYIHFPMLTLLRPWEGHPFSIIPTAMLRPLQSSSSPLKSETEAGSSSSDIDDKDIEKSAISSAITTAPDPPTIGPTTPGTAKTSGLTFYIRKSSGLTKHLNPQARLLTLLDGPYPNNPVTSLLSCDRLLLLAGGIGITGVLPFLATSHQNIKICWTIRPAAKGIMSDLDPVLSRVREKEVKVGERMDVDALLREEARQGWKKVGVVVCGPPSLCDDGRAAVVKVSRDTKCVFDLEVDAFSW